MSYEMVRNMPVKVLYYISVSYENNQLHIAYSFSNAIVNYP